MKLSSKLFVASFVSAASSLGAAYGADLVGKPSFLEFWLAGASFLSGIGALMLIYFAVDCAK